MNTLTITFNNQQFNIRTNAEGLYSLTDIEKAWKQSGGVGKRLDNWKTSPEVKELMEAFPEIQVVGNIGGLPSNTGTWASKEALIEYCGHCSTMFKMSTLRAMKQLSEGNYLEASDTLLSQIQTTEFKEKFKAAKAALYASYLEWDEQQSHSRHFDKIIMKNLIEFPTCGITSKKTINESGVPLLYVLLESGNTEGVTAMLHCLDMVKNAMDVNLGYYQIKKIIAPHLFTDKDAIALVIDLKARDEAQQALKDNAQIEAEAMLSEF